MAQRASWCRQHIAYQTGPARQTVVRGGIIGGQCGDADMVSVGPEVSHHKVLGSLTVLFYSSAQAAMWETSDVTITA